MPEHKDIECGKFYYLEPVESVFNINSAERGTGPQHVPPNGNRAFFNLTEGIVHEASFPMNETFGTTIYATLIAPIDVEEDGKIDFVV